MRVLGVDFGGARIGLAAMDSKSMTPRALPPLAATGTLAKDAALIAAAARKEEAELAVVGIPLSDGEETKMSRICRMLAEKIEAEGLRVELVDESLTSQMAEEGLRAEGLTAGQAKKRVDGEAAIRILLRWAAERDSQETSNA